MVRRLLAAGIAGTIILASGSPTQAMFMQVIDDQIVLSGEVQMGDFERLRGHLDGNPRITTVVLRDSPGGSVQPMWNVMKLIRDRQLRTAISGYCVSACAMMFLGGVERQFTDDQAAGKTYVAFHGPHNQNGTVSGTDTAVFKQVILSYSRAG